MRTTPTSAGAPPLSAAHASQPDDASTALATRARKTPAPAGGARDAILLDRLHVVGLPKRTRRVPRPAPRPAPPGTPKPSASSTKRTSSGEWAFLDDPKMSLDEKLFRFMSKMAKQMDDAVVKKMKEMREARAGTSSASSSASRSASSSHAKGGGILGGILDAAKVLVAPLGLADKVLGEGGMDALLKTVTGPVLAAGATAVGFPELAPWLLRAGSSIGSAAHEGLHVVEDLVEGTPGSNGGASSGPLGATSSGSATGSSGSGETKASGSEPGKYDEIDLLELQRMVEKQKEMMTAVTNTLRALHDMRMSAIQNIR